MGCRERGTTQIKSGAIKKGKMGNVLGGHSTVITVGKRPGLLNL